MKPKLYSAIEDGNVLNVKTGKLIQVESFTVQNGRRGQVIAIQKKGGGEKRIHRWRLDESKFNFGPVSIVPAARARHRPVRPEGPPPSSPQSQTALATREVSFKLKREDAVHMLKILRGVEEILMRELITETMEHPS